MFKHNLQKNQDKIVAQAQPQTNYTELRNQSQLQKTQQMLIQLDERMDQLDEKVIQLNLTIRKLIGQNNRLQARAKIAELKGYQKQIALFQTKRNVLTQFIIQIETLDQDMGVAQVVIQATDLAKQQTCINEKLSDQMLDYAEFQQQQQETQILFDQMAQVGVDHEDIDQTYEMYEKELNPQIKPIQIIDNKIITKKPQQQQVQVDQSIKFRLESLLE